MRDGQAVHFTAGGQLASGVETEPAQPEDKYAQRRQGQVVSRDGPALAVLSVFSPARAQGQRTGQGQDAAHAVHDGAAGKIVETQLRQPAAAPGPVTLDGIDKERDYGAVNQVHREFGALRHGAAHNRGRRRAEDRLENQESLYRELSFIEREVAPVGGADESGPFAAEHEAEAYEEKEQRAEHKIDEVFH